MSYLHMPRLCVHGTFLAEGVTANNVLAALDEVNTPAFQPDKNGWHNNNCASNHFWLVGALKPIVLAVRPGTGSASCDSVQFTPENQDISQVVSAWDVNGAASTDPVLGAAVSGRGVMADLDPEHRRVTDLCGLRLELGHSGQGNLLEGTLRTTQLRDYWESFYDDSTEVVGVSTVWAAVLDHLAWGTGVSQSPVLNRLQTVSGTALSVRLVLTHYNTSLTSPRKNSGKFLAVIGPHFAGEPEQLVPGRRLVTPGDMPPYGASPMASFLVDEPRQKLVVDLGSLVPRTLDPATTMLTKLTALTNGKALGSPANLSVGDWLKSAGIIEWDLTVPMQALLAHTPLQLKFTQTIDGVPTDGSLEEHATGKYFDVDRRNLRLNPGESATIAVYARQFGKPLAGEVVRFDLRQQCILAPIKSLGIQKGDPYYPKNDTLTINSEPANIFDGSSAPFLVTTDAQGRGELHLKIKPGPLAFPPARKSIGSQLYFLGNPEGWQPWGALGPPVGSSCALVLLVFNSETFPSAPTWADVAPIFSRYARLFPYMKLFVDLADEAQVKLQASVIRQRLELTVEDTGYMPVTRDLSASQRALLISYLKSVARPPSSPQHP
jgi:hypothetical protein